MSDIAPWLNACLYQIQLLKKQKRLSHALLVRGSGSVGQEELADAIMKYLMCDTMEQNDVCGQCQSCQLTLAETHPDCYILDGEKITIKVDQIRQLVRWISQKSQMGKNKVVLIKQAQFMNTNATSALLKALEEPVENIYFLLTSSQSNCLLPTIRSRCLLVNIPTPNFLEVKQWLSFQPNGKELDKLLWLTTEPFRLLKFKEKDEISVYKELPHRIKNLLVGKESLDHLLKNVDNTNVDSYCNGFSAILQHCVSHSAGRVLHPDLSDIYHLLVQRMTVQHMICCYQSLQTLRSNILRTNLNPVMQLTYELNQW